MSDESAPDPGFDTSLFLRPQQEPFIPEMKVIGGGSTAVATDALLAQAEGLHSIAESASLLAPALFIAAGYTEQAQLAGACSGWAIDAHDGVERARLAVVQLGRRAGELADDLDTSALNYGEVERSTTTGFTDLAGGALRGVAWASTWLNPGTVINLLFAGWLAGEVLDGGEPLDASGITMSPEMIQRLSDPTWIYALRALVPLSDDYLGGLFLKIDDAFVSDAGGAALILMLIGSFGGVLNSDTAVRVAKVGSRENVTPPAGIQDRANNTQSAADGDRAQIRIDRYTEPGQPDSFEVYIGGTADFSPVPGVDPFDLTSNLQLVAGLPAGALTGVLEAMTAAGISTDSPVVFTGHSQGGIIAASIVASEKFNTMGLVTFGAPVGQIAIPAGIPALLVEHREDLVPALGGMQQNISATTVQLAAYAGPEDVPTDRAMPAHRIEAYSQSGWVIDNNAVSTEVTSVIQALDRFSAGKEATSTYYYVTREE